MTCGSVGSITGARPTPGPIIGKLREVGLAVSNVTGDSVAGTASEEVDGAGAGAAFALVAGVTLFAGVTDEAEPNGEDEELSIRRHLLVKRPA